MADVTVLGGLNAPSVKSAISQSIVDLATSVAVDVVVAGSSGQQVQILQYMLESATATKITLADESANLSYPVIMVANGGLLRKSDNPDIPLLVGTAGEKITATPSTTPSFAKLLVMWRYVANKP